MILFDDSTTVTGAVLKDALAWICNCQINGNRDILSGSVALIMKDSNPEYKNYNILNYDNVPYDISSSVNPVSQFYSWLVSQPMYQGGTQYPAS